MVEASLESNREPVGWALGESLRVWSILTY